MTLRPYSLCVGALLVFATQAQAVQQTTGETIPQTNRASGYLNTHEKTLDGLGDIDAVETATIAQETFRPLCQLTFTVVARGASYRNTFGWYPVQRDSAGKAIRPELSDMHVFLGCDDDIGVTRQLTIPSAFSEIGFFLANSQESCDPTEPNELGATLTRTPANMFFSQNEFNTDASGLIHLLVWQSHANTEAFYFGWEDISGGGDNDFEDLLAFVTGIQCASSGDLCSTGKLGVCAGGVEQCRDGEVTCVPLREAGQETCNALDDDCDGEVDDGELCPVNERCVRGRCVPNCGSGEFPCEGGTVCTDDGVCVDRDCASISCDTGRVCRAGKCVAPCDGIVCPFGHTCSAGTCVSVCESLSCDPGFACEVRASLEPEGGAIGVCSSCDCNGCPEGQRCESHLCVAEACYGKACVEGTHCVAGDCIDNCLDSVCPRGQRCDQGACVDDPNSATGGAGGAGGGNATGEGLITGFSGSGGVGGASGTAGAAPGGSSGKTELSADSEGRSKDGCGCRAAGGEPSETGSSSWASLAALVALVVGRRRHRRGSQYP